MQNLNRVVLTGNLTRDPELKQTQSDVKVCQLRVATNSRVKQGGEWTDKANFFDVVCFGSQAESVAKYLKKGKPLAVDGRLDWREWSTEEGSKRQAVQIIADSIQFLEGKRDSEDGGGAPAATTAAVSPPPDEDDIPF